VEPPVDGYGTAARFAALTSIAADTKGNLYVTESLRHSIRRINAMGLVSTLAGSVLNPGYLDDSAGTARFRLPLETAADTLGNVYVADFGNNCIRKVTPAGIVSTYSGVQGLSGNIDGNSATARFRLLTGIASDKFGNLYVTDRDDAVVRKVDINKNVTTIGGAAGFAGFVNSADNLGYTLFRAPGGMVADTTGNLYIADEGNHCIRRITPGGIVTTFAGTGATGNADGTLTTATFKSPKAMAIDMAGNLYVVDRGNHNIRKITPAGVVSTVAGSGSPGYLDGPDVAALFNTPSGIAVDAIGNLYVADNVNNTIRKIFLR
jgi:streptogramin lyase